MAASLAWSAAHHPRGPTRSTRPAYSLDTLALPCHRSGDRAHRPRRPGEVGDGHHVKTAEAQVSEAIVRDDRLDAWVTALEVVQSQLRLDRARRGEVRECSSGITRLKHRAVLGRAKVSERMLAAIAAEEVAPHAEVLIVSAPVTAVSRRQCGDLLPKPASVPSIGVLFSRAMPPRSCTSSSMAPRAR